MGEQQDTGDDPTNWNSVIFAEKREAETVIYEVYVEHIYTDATGRATKYTDRRHCLRRKEAVDAIIAEARRAKGRIARPTEVLIKYRPVTLDKGKSKSSREEGAESDYSYYDVETVEVVDFSDDADEAKKKDEQ